MELTYPLASGYVRDWDAVRALSELVANALDEDLASRMRYDVRTGHAVISDRGPGWPEEALVLGYTNKDDSQIGQFGEGAKLAMLVLCRELGPDCVEVRTAGMTIVPRLERRGLGLGRSESGGLELLVVEVTPNRRRVGTEVWVRCSEHLYRQVRARFRHLSERRYRPPLGAGEVLAARGGTIFVGGVLLRHDLPLVNGYDFALNRAKHLQNRDRTVLDGWELAALIGDALAYCTDVSAIERYARAALTGTLSKMEGSIAAVHAGSHESRQAWKRAGRRLLGPKVFWAPDGEEEADLAISDLGWRKLPMTLDQTSFAPLMERLGVPTARQALPSSRTRARFIARHRLPADDRARLARAVRAARARFGPDALGRVRIYDRPPEGMERSDGFFDPESGDVALHSRVLSDDRTLCTTLAHEMAHRRAWNAGGEWTDRSRGFEYALSELAGTALLPRAKSQPKGRAPSQTTPETAPEPTPELTPEPTPGTEGASTGP